MAMRQLEYSGKKGGVLGARGETTCKEGLLESYIDELLEGNLPRKESFLGRCSPLKAIGLSRALNFTWLIHALTREETIEEVPDEDIIADGEVERVRREVEEYKRQLMEELNVTDTPEEMPHRTR